MNWFFSRRRNRFADLSTELRSHLEEKIDDLVAQGVPRREAEAQARREFGNLTLTERDSRDIGRWPRLEDFLLDLRYALRLLRKSPGFTSVAVLTLALGIGANTAIFSIVHGILLSPLPYRDPDGLMTVWENNPRSPRTWVSYPNFQDWQRLARSFHQMAAFRYSGIDLTFPGEPEHLAARQISSGFFPTLGVTPALGRNFSADEDRAGATPVAIISDHLWRDRFAHRSEALGKTVTLDGVDYTVVGVAPPEFHLGPDTDIYTPLGQAGPMLLTDRASHDGIFCVARLAPGVNLIHAQAEMNTIQTSLDHLYPDDNRDLGIYVEPLNQTVIGDIGATLFLLLGAVGLVLLIACANVSNLVLARSASRAREFAIRSALGAGRARLIRQLLTENVLLALAGCGLGLLIASAVVKSVLATYPDLLPSSQAVHLNAPVLLFTLSVAVAVGIFFGLAPAFKTWNHDPQSSLKQEGRGSTGSQHRTQSGLVIIQMALTLVLLVGAGLLLRTIRQLWEVNPGFDAQHLISFRVGVSHSLTKTPASTRVAYQGLIERIRRIPGVQAADFTDVVPLSSQAYTLPFWVGAQRPASLQAAPRTAGFLTGPDYLKTMQIPLLRGRFFTAEDTTKSPCVFVIDTVFAQKYFPGTDPIGQTVSIGFATFGPCRIVGIVGHVKVWGLKEPPFAPENQLYVSLYQDPDQWVASNYPDTSVVARTSLDLSSLLPAIKNAVSAFSADQPVFDVQTMQQIRSQSMSVQRFPMILLASFACLALLLASVGIYGVTSYSVSERVREIGIRIALGAEKRSIFHLVLTHGFRLSFAGLGLGVVAALAFTRLLSSFSGLLYGVTPADPLTFSAVSTLLMAVTGLACYVPASRATRVDPLTALRHE
jgi:predicted permease